jgi:hypothetical protein
LHCRSVRSCSWWHFDRKTCLIHQMDNVYWNCLLSNGCLVLPI